MLMAEPTLCTSRDASIIVYTFWPMSGTNSNVQRYFSLTNFPSTAPTTLLPVVIQMNGYGGDSKLGSDTATSGAYYGFTWIGLSTSLTDQAGGSLALFLKDRGIQH